MIVLNSPVASHVNGSDSLLLSSTEDRVSTLVDALIHEQRELTAVSRFSQLHESGHTPLLESHYKALIPLTKPQSGEQYAFDVDLDRCSACKACVSACHSMNGLDDNETWREVGFLSGIAKSEETGKNKISESTILFRQPSSKSSATVHSLTQVVTTACHHCVEPACLLGCPVLAYHKDPVTGIVRHLDDQCIGCSYCVLKCPYDVPKYSSTRGIVRKCDLCQGRLAHGEAPACVQACPNEAIRISIVDLAEVRSLYRNRDGTSKEPLKNSFLPDSPAPHYTLPTTRYRTAKDWSEVRRGDHYRNDPQPTHGPLVLMLVLTQAGIGGWIGSLFLVNSQLFGLLAGGSLGLFCSGLVASVFHLGQPLKAWRVWMGWRTSWLSREAIALNSFVGCALGLTAFLILGDGSMGSRSLELAWIVGGGLAFTAILAQCGVYTDTGRHFWNWRQTAVRFYGTSWILGFSLHAWIAPGPIPMFSILIGTFIKMSAELSVLLGEKNGNQPVSGQIQRTQRLLKGVLRFHFLSRILVGVISGMVLPLLGIAGFGFPGLASCIVIGCFAAELMERALFFRAVAPDKMPGFQ